MLRLRKIEVMGRDGIVDGFRFEYEDNLVRSFGCQDSEKHVLDFTKHKDEKPSCLVVHYITDSRSALEVRLPMPCQCPPITGVEEWSNGTRKGYLMLIRIFY